MNINDKKYQKNLDYYIMDISAFEQPIISREDTSYFSMDFINQKDNALKPIFLDESFEENLTIQSEENNLLSDLNQIIDNNLFLLKYSSGNNNIHINLNVNK
jgi:hypothetical protein